MTEHRLDWRDGKWHLLGDLPLHSDELECARIMLRNNFAERSDTITTYRGDTPCLKMGVGWAADHIVGTSNMGTPIFRLAGAGRRLAGGQNDAEASNDQEEA